MAWMKIHTQKKVKSKKKVGCQTVYVVRSIST